jgi:release factor glutamine methyltransferase
VTVADVVRKSADYLAGKGVPSPRVDAEHLVSTALGMSRLDLYLEHDRPLTETQVAGCRELVRRRGAREPLAYVIGEWGFRRLTLRVDRRALIPRPETEIVVERCLALLRDLAEPAVLDVGTGSGAIGLAIADEHPGARVTATDVSTDALALAAENVERLGLGDRVRLLRHDLADPLPGGPYDLVVSNPPYVGLDELETLQPEVRDWEPRDALVGSGATQAFARGARAAVRRGGHVVVEVADGTDEEIANLLTTLGFRDVGCTTDLAGRMRVVEGRWES